MTDVRSQVEAAIADLAADPALAPLVRPEAALLVADLGGERLLWASPAAASLRDALVADGDGGLDPALPLVRRLRGLAQGLSQGVRLERVRLAPNALAPLVTCGFRRLALPSGEEALLIVVAEPLPAMLPRRKAGLVPAGRASRDRDTEDRDPEAEALSAPAAGEAPAGAVQASPPPSGGTVRFLWHADAEGRFTSVSDALAAVVGPAAADVVGKRWDEIAGRLVADPAGSVSRAFAEAETWTGRVVEWRASETGAVPVDLAGMPVFGRDGRLLGFRGFGLCRTGEVRTRPGPGAFQNLDPLGRTDEPAPAAAAPETQAASGPASPQPDAGAPAPAPDEPPPGPPDGTGSFAGLHGSVAGRFDEPRIPLRVEGDPPETESRDDGGPANGSEPAEPREHPPRTAPRLSAEERNAFREIARALGARFEDEDPASDAPRPAEASPPRKTPVVTPLRPAPPVDADVARILDRLPIGILIHRGDEPLFLNRLLLDLVGYDDAGQLAAEGGVPRLFRGRAGPPERFETMDALALTTRRDGSVPVEVRLTTVEWDGLPASLMVVRKAADTEQGQRLRALELDLRVGEARLRELSSILDVATDGVIVLDEAGRILSLNRSAEALFGYDQNEVAGERFIVLLAPESHGVALEYLDGLRANGVASLLNDGREVVGRVRQGGTIPLFMTVGRISEAPDKKFCAVLRDITSFKKTEGELLSSKRAAEEASAQKSDFLAKVSHEIRTPLNAIIGFAEVMLEERFGPVGNERYKDYLRDIHASGGHVISLVNDLLDLAKVEAGRMELAFTSVNLNELAANGVALMQPQAARERIVMRTSFAQKLPAVVADERSVRQIILNVIANAIRFTEAGGQVIVSTALTDRGEAAIRVRDTGLGMSPEEVEAAMQPFRQLATSRRGGGTGLGLPLTKALVEANRGALRITSARNEGTLVEVLFPPTRVLAD
ncbi:MAG TPA: PAS domain S-box protein [Beijerinckiaceae bacterium]|jgi:PAS domain S-box-containing protein